MQRRTFGASRGTRAILGVLVTAVVVAALAAAGLYWFLSGDGVRTALEQQATAWLGQPVRIERATASLFPRVALRLENVRVGDAAQMMLSRVDLSTGLRPLLSRRIEDADAIVSTGRVEMPLPFGVPSFSQQDGVTATAGALAAGMQIVSVRTIVLEDVTLASRGREITVTADSSLDGGRLIIRRLTVGASDTLLNAQGTVDFEPALSATIHATANQLDFDDLLTLAAAFTTSQASTAASRHVTASITSPRASLAGVPVTRFEASLLADGADLRIEPLRFDIFGGRHDGWLDVTVGDALDVRTGVGVSNVDLEQLAAFGGTPGAVTGRLYGSGRFGARGQTVADVVGALRGVGEAMVSAGTITRLEIVQAIVNVIGGNAPAETSTSGERFDAISATFALADRTLRSDDLTLQAPDFDVFSRGTLALPTKALDVRADLVVSERLSARAGRDLLRFTRAGNRIVLPAVITGTLAEPRVRIDAGAAVRRGLQNEVERRLEDLFERIKPPL